MTEQEKREKAIAKMVKDSEPHETDVTVEQYAHIVSIGGFKDFARAYDAGYRKEEEVRKETALEYSNRIDEIVTWCISNKIGDDFDYEYFSNCIRNLKKDFGVEVEE